MTTKPATQVIETLKNLTDAYDGSYYTILGAGGDLNEYRDGYNGWLEEAKIGTPTRWFKTTGAKVNDFMGVRAGSPHAFPPRLTILMFPLDGLRAEIAIFKIAHEDRWFDDVVDNTRRHERDA